MSFGEKLAFAATLIFVGLFFGYIGASVADVVPALAHGCVVTSLFLVGVGTIMAERVWRMR